MKQAEDRELWIELVTRVTADERRYRQLSDQYWDQRDAGEALYFRGMADGLDLARTHHAAVVAEAKENGCAVQQAEDELNAAAATLADAVARSRRTGTYMLFTADGTELLQQLLEGEAARWAERPIGDLDAYLMSPACKLARHILGRKP